MEKQRRVIALGFFDGVHLGHGALLKRTVELAEKLEVSRSTVRWDMDALSAAGVPVYTAEGAGGGVALLPGYVLDRSAFSEEEQLQLLLALRCLPDREGGQVLAKLSALFGRGGEEAMALAAAGIPYEVVPGVTSAVAGAACAGIPVTHRGLSGGFHVVTAHDRRDELADIDFEALVQSGDTLVFLMGLSKLTAIASRLQEAGMMAETGAAVISHATLPEQKVCQGTLSDIAVRAEKEGLTSPALIVVGLVVGLRDQLAALERKKTGFACLVPKIGKQPSVLASRLREKGMDVEELQVGEIVYTDWKMDRAVETIPDWLIFTSRHGVEGFFRGMIKAGTDIRTFAGSRIAVIGNKTAEKLGQYGLKPDLMPDTADSMAFCDSLNKVLRQEDVVWYLKAEETVQILQEGLAGKCHLICKNVYANWEVKGKPGREFYDAIVFTCASSVRRLFAAGNTFTESGLFSIGPVCTEQLLKFGREDVIQADHASYEALVHKICEYHREEGEL